MKNPNRITEFQGPYRWLSNFWPVGIVYKGRIYPSVENAYQAQKSEDPEWQSFCSDITTTPGQTKKRSRKLRVPQKFHDEKLQIMEDLLRLKFADPALRQKLVETYPHPIYEGNKWGDTFWGVVWTEDGTYRGLNHLGNIIMRIRKEIIHA